MRINVPAALYMFSVSTIELAVGGRALRVDLGSFISVFRSKPWLMLYIPPTVAFMFLVGGVPGIVSALLLVSPFAALAFGKTIGSETAKNLEKFFYVLFALGVLQWLLGARIVGYLYRAGHTNKLPVSLTATEPSFAFEALFAQAVLLAVLLTGRRAIFPLIAILFLATLADVQTVYQNTLLLCCGGLFARLPISKNRATFLFLALLPTILCYLFPAEAKLVGFFFLSEFQSWRQISNLVAISESGWIEFLLTDYRRLVGQSLLSDGHYNLFTWIESAFSWFPFLHSIGGRFLAFTAFGLLFLRTPSISRLLWKERAVLYSCMMIFLYSAPKWQFFPVITIGAIFAIAAARNRTDDSGTPPIYIPPKHFN